jgi:CheY-like chemotaxis protein
VSARVLIIEDNLWQAQYYERILKKAGYSTFVTSSGSEAIIAVDDYSPDVIIADVLLNCDTIFPLLNEMQSHAELAKIPVVISSNIASSLDGVDCAAYGVVAVIDKSTTDSSSIIGAVKKATIA